MMRPARTLVEVPSSDPVGKTTAMDCSSATLHPEVTASSLKPRAIFQ
jgi:hypothetical protein